jgi:hypothetical protein
MFLFSHVDLNLLEYLRLEPVLATRLLLTEARIALDLWVEFVPDVNHREVRFVKLFDSLFLVLIKSGEPVIVAEGIVNSVAPHPLNHLFILLR